MNRTPNRVACLVGQAVLATVFAPSFAVAQELPQPTPQHEEMAREAGVWDAKVKTWMAPGAPPQESTGTETCQMLGGFWLESRFEGEFGGEPYTGVAQTGYDPEKQEYVSTWIDTMTPSLLVSRGGYDADSHTLTLYSNEHTCCYTGTQKRLKLVTKYADADHKHFEMYETPADEENWSKTMEIDYTRR